MRKKALIEGNMPTVKVPSGTVPATHHHTFYGYCIITNRVSAKTTIIQTNNGSAVVAHETLTKIEKA